jgi:Spy/CpxP family protein refolding chaperone
MQFRNVMALSVVGACAAGLVFAQEKPQPTKAVQVAQKDKPEKTEAKKPRLPNYFGKLNISDEQRGRILDLLTDYNDQIDALEEQIQELRTKRDAEVRAVLTAKQRDTLAELEGEAKKKRAEKSAKGKKTAEPAEESN